MIGKSELEKECKIKHVTAFSHCSDVLKHE